MKPLLTSKHNSISKRYINLFRTSNKLKYNNNQFDPKDIPSLNRFSSYTKQAKENNLKHILKIIAFGCTFMAGTFFGLPLLKDYIPKDPNVVIYSIVGLNLAVFGLWHIKPNNFSFQKKLTESFLLQKNFHILKLRQMILSGFSHKEFWHLGCNMLCLISFSGPLIATIGSVGYLSLYFNALMMSSMFSVLYPNILKALFKRVSSTSFNPSLGASGALFGVFGVFSYLYPNAHLSLFFIPLPLGAWQIFIGSVGFNVMGVVMRVGALDFLAHLGGSVVGIFYGLYFKHIIDKKRQARAGRTTSLFDIFK
ncbi:hypothetical protein FOG48_02138 [Hanseniaspora uvarum]|nr:hypothetical protein FOG48_02138 [Hanseniaspora uvarum]